MFGGGPRRKSYASSLQTHGQTHGQTDPSFGDLPSRDGSVPKDRNFGHFGTRDATNIRSDVVAYRTLTRCTVLREAEGEPGRRCGRMVDQRSGAFFLQRGVGSGSFDPTVRFHVGQI